ncbi:cholesterol oxidase substrate-binding domain-containing protein [Acinetobacter larvae]|uniref:Dehydrogenase n=1 Tax=Acinetobacter larvae TaxID=1789224 RepID=A0A1B2M0W4_9GAMM|nr:cholesterol oxidase substrate-binding domain-containing protein [Acinetobacter larvae]AOA58818.1 dehydrogenase [Acinetobacter larvae]
MNDNKVLDASKRDFLKTMGSIAAVGAVSTWVPTQKAEAWFFLPKDRIANFPSNITLFKQRYENWSGESRYEDAWTARPRNQEQVLRIINWAAENGYKVRPKGMSHNWSPLMLNDQDKKTKILLVDMPTYINKISINSKGIVTAEAGIQMEALLKAMENRGRGFVATPAPGDLTLGGVLAINGHGTAVPAKGERKTEGQTYGSISNLVVSITAAVYDQQQRKYVAKTFYRNEPDIRAFLVNLGRAFVLSAQLQTSKNQYLRCQSIFNVHQKELFAPNAKSGRTFSHFLDQSGRVEAIWFPFTDYPWIKIWSITPNRPLTSRIATHAFNYWFAENIPKSVLDLIKKIVIDKSTYLTPSFGSFQYKISKRGVEGSIFSGISTLLTNGRVSTQTYDLWGPSKNTLLYVKPSTLRVTANGYAVLTSRANVQRVIADFCTEYQVRVKKYQRMNRYPMNGPVEIRVTGLDQPNESVIPNAQTPALSAIKPCPDHPEWDCAVWFDILTLPGTPYAEQFYAEIEAWMSQHYQGDCLMRPEWSKGWGYSNTKAWDSRYYFEQELPRVHAQGQHVDLTIQSAAKVLKQYDPLDLFTSPLINKILKY